VLFLSQFTVNTNMSFFDSPEGKLKKYTKQIKELNRSNHQRKLIDFCQRIFKKHFNDFNMLNNICGILELEKLHVLAEFFITRLIEIDPDIAIAKLRGTSQKKLEQIRLKKLKARGGFTKNLFLISTRDNSR